MKTGKVLVAGAKGMLGQALSRAFSGHSPVLIDKDALDITDIAAVEAAVKKIRPDAIINAAAYTDVDECEENIDACREVNAKGPGNLAKISQKYDIKLVHYSTDYVFDGQKPDGYTEDHDDLDPINAYGRSKAEGERAVRSNSANYYIIRIAWLYGPGGKNFVNTMVELGRKKDVLKVVDDQRGSPTYTKDAAETTKFVLENDLVPGVYHSANAGSCTWYEFAQEIFALKNIPAELEPCRSGDFPRPAKRPRYSILINTKLPQMRHWKAALKEYLASNPRLGA